MSTTMYYTMVMPIICSSGENNKIIFNVNKNNPIVIMIANRPPIKNVILKNLSMASPVICM